MPNLNRMLKIAGILLVAAAQIGETFAAQPESPGDFRKRQKELISKNPYMYVFGSDGIDCDVGHRLDNLRPSLNGDGHFSCPCSTDMGCQMVNPHILDQSGDIDAKVLAKAPKGSNCKNAIPWSEAKQNIGRTLVVVGKIANVTTSQSNQKSTATWINVGERFPNINRLTLVIWDDTHTLFKLRQPKQLEGKYVCVVGKISAYKGSPQIVVKEADEFLVSQ